MKLFSAVYNYLKLMDPRLRGDGKKEDISAFYEPAKIEVFHPVGAASSRDSCDPS